MCNVMKSSTEEGETDVRWYSPRAGGRRRKLLLSIRDCHGGTNQTKTKIVHNIFFDRCIMPLWEGIEDASATPEPIWFARTKKSDPWKPLRKIDCRKLNDPDHITKGRVVIEGGRATAFLSEKLIKYNFYNAPDRELCSAVWFETVPGGAPRPIFCRSDSDQIEALYQTALRAFSSLSGDKDFVASVLKTEVLLSSSSAEADSSNSIQFAAFVSQNASTKSLSIKKRPTPKQLLSFTDSSVLLQRGYDSYTVEGEAEEVALGPVRHLIFVVHGIGEAMWSKEDVNMPDSIEELNCTRAAMHKRQIEIWKKECARAEKEKCSAPAPPNRIELLPIQWYHRIHSSSGSLKKTLNCVTLNSIPALRAIANDVVFDVLMYLTPEFCQEVLECVAAQICDLFSKFKDIHEHFASSGGKCSLIGHSLGSVIVWDLLSFLKAEKESKASKSSSTWIPEYLCGACPSSSSANLLSNGDNSYMPVIKTKMTNILPFEPHFTCFLGSPLGLFLTLRGANAVFEQLSTQSSGIVGDDEGISQHISPFTLPSGAVYNIFHPSDPVVYRIEPLLFPSDTDPSLFPAPAMLITKEGGMRAHYALKQLSDDLTKSFMQSTAKFGSLLSDTLKNFGAQVAPNGEQRSEKKEIKFALGGRSARVDYQIQQGIVENEYLSAVTAHSTYFRNSDVLDFIIETGTESCSSNFVQYHT